jgi:hypothetical protein
MPVFGTLPVTGSSLQQRDNSSGYSNVSFTLFRLPGSRLPNLSQRDSSRHIVDSMYPYNASFVAVARLRAWNFFIVKNIGINGLNDPCTNITTTIAICD